MNMSFQSRFAKMSDGVFFLLLAIFQLIFMFQGLDFADEGCHAATYQQIFSHPESMVGDFMYWFAGIFGGVFYYFFSDWGLLGLRIQGLLTILATMMIAYYLLKRYTNIAYLRIGMILIFMLTTNEIKEMHYDTLTALLNVGAALFLFNGLRDNRMIPIMLSGALISLSMFTRLPSIVMLVLILAIGYFGMINKSKLLSILKQALALIAGFVLMTLLVLLLMKLIGHLPVYIDALKMVFSWGASSDDSHSIFRLVKRFIIDYSSALKFGVLIIVFLLLLNYFSLAFTQFNKRLSDIIIRIIKITIVLFVAALLFKEKINHSKLISIFTGISLIISAFILLSSKTSKELKLLTFIGCLIVFFEPLGSAGGISTSGKHSLWILFPVAIDFAFRIKSINSKYSFFDQQDEFSFNIDANSGQLATVKKYFLGLSALACLYWSYYYPYFDMSDRIYMTHSIENKNARGIYTTKERATVVNELLQESAKYVKKNDYVMAYDCIPMFHYLTETLPYTTATWPWLYVPQAFHEELIKARSQNSQLPVIILQKMSTLGTNWPQNANDDFIRTEPEQQRDSIMQNFIAENKYKKIWENVAFEILLPEEFSTNSPE